MELELELDLELDLELVDEVVEVDLLRCDRVGGMKSQR